MRRATERASKHTTSRPPYKLTAQTASVSSVTRTERRQPRTVMQLCHCALLLLRGGDGGAPAWERAVESACVRVWCASSAARRAVCVHRGGGRVAPWCVCVVCEFVRAHVCDRVVSRASSSRRSDTRSPECSVERWPHALLRKPSRVSEERKLVVNVCRDPSLPARGSRPTSPSTPSPMPRFPCGSCRRTPPRRAARAAPVLRTRP